MNFFHAIIYSGFRTRGQCGHRCAIVHHVPGRFATFAEAMAAGELRLPRLPARPRRGEYFVQVYYVADGVGVALDSEGVAV